MTEGMETLMMRDIILLFIFLALAGLAWLRPWMGALVMMVLTFMHPQGYSSGWMGEAPVYLTMFGIVTLRVAIQHAKLRTLPRLPIDWRLFTILALWLWFLVTSYFSLVPWAAWDKFGEVLKILPPLVLLLLLIDSREKFVYLMITIAFSILLVALKGGYWAVMTGFQDRVYGPPGSPYQDNNAFAVIVAMAIPLLVMWMNEAGERILRGLILVGILLCYSAIISSWSRGGLLALAVVTVFLLLASRHKGGAILLLLLIGSAMFIQLPETWFDRMQTLFSAQQDQSAQARLAVWKIGLEYALSYPVTGTGFDSWPALTYADGNQDWHSMYVEILVEHGFVGLAIWSVLLFGTLLHLSLLCRGDGWRANAWPGQYAAMLRASLAAYAVGGATLGITYWEQAYILVIATVVLTRLEKAANSASRDVLHAEARGNQNGEG